MLYAALFAALTAVVSPVKIPLGFTPVPITLQTLMVLLSGAVLGARYGALSQALYLLVGALGLPVFAGGGSGFGAILGPTGGYLLSYPLAAATVGFMKDWKDKRAGMVAMCLLALVLITTYADLIFGIGFISFGGNSLVALMTFTQRMVFVIVSLAVIAALFVWLLREKEQAPLLSGMVAATLVIYLLGAVWGKLVTGLPWSAVFVGWVLPFIIGDTVKLLLAASVAKRIKLK